MKKLFSLKKQTADCIGLGVGVVIGMSISRLLKTDSALHDNGIMFISLMVCSLVCILIIRRLNERAP